ncbi:MAG: flagellar hook-basal body complex protein, partial [Thermoguttaceae bacterium]|nr:flagellar hook-basal body complex protein [Thermoguttaceae bacterium]
MGLASAMSTALTGLTAAETTIDVVGNNLANSSTVGFKASQASFATQFLQTLSLGAQPTGDSGGTNPRQVGLGTMVSDITPDFSQGTVEISSNPLDLAIQGEGFYVVQGRSGEQLYTRNGIFKLNAANEIVTITGNRLLGFGVDDQYQIQRTVLEPITIPLGAASVAQPTQNAYLEGQLTPTGDIADIAQIIQTGILGDSRYEHPTAAPTAEIGAAGDLDGSYNYYVTYYNTANGRESRPFESPSLTLNVDNQQINLSDLPQPADLTQWDEIRIYRNVANTNEYHRVASLAAGTTTYTDTTGDNVLATLPLIDFDGPKIAYDTLLTNIRQRDGHRYEQVFEEGTLQFTGRKGGRAQETKSLTIDANTTVSDLITFMEESLGIQRTPGPDPVHPIPIDSASGNDPGGKVTLDGRIVLTGNNGRDNAIEIGLSNMLMVTSTGATNVNLPFGTAQLAVGESAVTDFIVY